MMVLLAFYKGLTMWEEAPDKKLPEEVWHVTDHYENIRKKFSELKEEDIACLTYNELDPKRICNTPLNVSCIRCIRCIQYHLISFTSLFANFCCHCR